MIITNKIEKVDDNWRLILYDTDQDGRCVPELKKTDFHDDINIYYIQQAERLERLLKQLMANEISPLKFFVDYYRIGMRDLAARSGVRASTIKRHLTPKGFAKARVEALQSYARVFNIGVGDFFLFLHIPEELSVEIKRYNDRLEQQITIKRQNT